MTTRRHRLRRFAKWAGLFLYVPLVGAIVASCWWHVAVSIGGFFVFVQWGAIGFEHHSSDLSRLQIGRNIQSYPLWMWVDVQPHPGGHTTYIVPLWMPLLLIGITTFILWRRDRRYPRGRCQECGYDLTGNVSGVCAECGTKIEKESAA